MTLHRLEWAALALILYVAALAIVLKWAAGRDVASEDHGEAE